jgi:PAS domain S-box-containing protein
MAMSTQYSKLSAKIIGTILFIGGVAVLLGWASNMPLLKSVFPGLVTMKANTAMGILLGGMALALLSRERLGRPHRFCVAAFAVVIVVLGLLTLGEYFFGWNVGIDELLFRDAISSVGTSQPGRMSPSTAFSFILVGSALLVASRRIMPRLRFAILSALGATVFVIGGAATLGQISNLLLNFRVWNYFGMAIHTAVGFMLLGAGLLAFVKGEKGMSWALDKTTTLGFVIAIGVMLTAAGVSCNYTNQLQETASWVSRTNETLKQIEDVRADKANLESIQRGYLILGDENLLAPREQFKANVRQDIQDLRRLTADNPKQQQYLNQLEPLIAQRTDFAEQIIAVRRQQGFPAAQKMLATGPGLALSADIARVLGAMRDEEYSRLVARQKQSDAVSITTFLLLPLGVFLSLTILSLALFFLNAGVDERAQAEEVAAQLAAIVNSSNDAIIGKDLNSIITSWNIGAEKLFGYSANEMIGEPITRLIPPDHQAEELEIINRIKNGESVEHFETVRITKDGHLIDISATVSPIKDKTGKIVGASKVARDITERKRAEDTLRRQAAIIDLSPDAIIVRDLEGKIISWSRGAETLYGWTKEEALGRITHSLFQTRFSEPLEKIMEQFEKTDRWSGELVHRTKDGREVNIQSWWLAEFNALGERKAMLESNIDITERKRAEQEIRDLNITLEKRVAERTAELEVANKELGTANKELEAFSYSVSHDLRAPLRAVDGFSQAVLEDYGALLPPEGQRDLQTIREGAQRMGVLIDDLLTFSRLSRMPLNRETVNIDKLVHDVIEGLNSERQGRQIEIRMDKLPLCQGDPALLKQVWINLLSNAVKYTRHRNPAVIEIGCKLEPENVYFVRDNGAGFDMKYVHKLFGVFQRLHRADQFEGTGVGLAIVQRVIHRHGGRIWAEAALDRGATFYFTLNGETKV